MRDMFKHALMKLAVVLIYVVSHCYDYICYPIYFIAHHPWIVRKYKRSNHARREDRDDCVIFHSLAPPSEKNVEMQRHGLDTMDKVFDFVSCWYIICLGTDRHSPYIRILILQLTSQYKTRDCLGTREVLAETDEAQPNGRVFKKYVLGSYKWRSFEDLATEASRVSIGLRHLGLKSSDRIAIVAETRAEWIITAYACFRNNLTLVTLYTNLGNSGLIHALNETQVTFLVCTMETLAKVKQIHPKCPSLKTVLLMDSISPAVSSADARKELDFNVVLYEELVERGASLADSEDGCSSRLPVAAHDCSPNDCAIIMYTSGSTGDPKGVMLSHRNLVSAMSALINIAKFVKNDRYIAYLPLAHVLELLAETSCLLYGIKIGYSSANTLTNKSSMVKAGSKGDVNLFRPTLMCSVPLILERIYKSVVDTMKRQGWAAEELFHYFMAYKMKVGKLDR
jgi:long-chain acyl-CoA synthetase